MRPILITAFLEGLSVLVVEIAGARALAPYFGASLHVWTAQITATLLFLALGYGLGGVLCRRGPMALPAVFWVAGGWLALYPVWRTGLLASLTALGVSGGASVASAILFGPPLACMGAVSPLLIQRLGRGGLEGGQAAGWLFFTNTLGGLAGGWLTALVLMPNIPLRWVLAGTGVALATLGGLWTGVRTLHTSTVWLLPLLCTSVASLGATPVRTLPSADGGVVRVIERVESHSGSILVLERPGVWRSLLLNGIDQGAMDLATGTSFHPFSEYLAYAAHRYHPDAKRALLLGLGCGVLAKSLAERGLDVTVAEIEPEISAAARRHFDLPASVRVVAEDGRTFLARDRGRYDLVILDAFAGESAPWYLLTREGLVAARQRLAPGGRLVVNAVTIAEGNTEGLRRMEATLLEVFGEAVVFLEPRLPTEAAAIINATLVAGAKLEPSDRPYPGTMGVRVAPFVGDMNALGPRSARPGATIDHDDHSSLEVVDSALRLRWRENVIDSLPLEVL